MIDPRASCGWNAAARWFAELAAGLMMIAAPLPVGTVGNRGIANPAAASLRPSRRLMLLPINASTVAAGLLASAAFTNLSCHAPADGAA
jgi:hypothetical protein